MPSLTLSFHGFRVNQNTVRHQALALGMLLRGRQITPYYVVRLEVFILEIATKRVYVLHREDVKSNCCYKTLEESI